MPRAWAAFRPHALPIITVRRDPWAVRALADTGAQISLIHTCFVLQLDLPLMGDLSVVGLSTAVLHGPRGRLEGFHIARLPLQAYEAGVFNLGHLRLGIDLILGINALEGYRLQFDCATGRLFLLALRL